MESSFNRLTDLNITEALFNQLFANFFISVLTQNTFLATSPSTSKIFATKWASACLTHSVSGRNCLFSTRSRLKWLFTTSLTL